MFLNLTFCDSKQNDVDKKVLLKNYNQNEVYETDTLHLKIGVRNDSIIYNYKKGNDEYIFSFSKPQYNDSMIYLYELNCPLISEKTYQIDGEIHKILKYFYDEENVTDEESSYFYHKDYGIIVGYNDGWANLIFSMEHDYISKSIIDSIIIGDSKFEGFKIPPPTYLDE